MRTTYIAMSLNYWGRGTTIDEAKKELRKAGGSLTRGTMIVVQVDEGDEYADKPLPYVDGMGCVVSHSRESTIVEKRNNGKSVLLVA